MIAMYMCTYMCTYMYGVISIVYMSHTGVYGQMPCIMTGTGQPCVPSCIPAYSAVEFTCALKIYAGYTQWNINTGVLNCSLLSMAQFPGFCTISAACGGFTASNVVPTSGPCLNSTLTGTIYSGYNGVIQCASIDQNKNIQEMLSIPISSSGL